MIYVIAESDGDSWGPPKRAYLTKKHADRYIDGDPYLRAVAVELICPRTKKKTRRVRRCKTGLR